MLNNKIDFSAEQAMLLDTANKFFRAKSAIDVVRNQMVSKHGFDRAV